MAKAEPAPKNPPSGGTRSAGSSPTGGTRSAGPSIIEYVISALLAWLIPGAGHWILGYRVRAVVLGASILGLFWLGQAMAVPPETTPYERKPIGVSRKVSPIFFACQVGNGLSALLSEALWGKPRYPNTKMDAPDRHLPRQLNLAILLTAVSGILNYLIILHLLDPRTWAQAARDREQATDDAQGGDRRDGGDREKALDRGGTRDGAAPSGGEGKKGTPREESR